MAIQRVVGPQELTVTCLDCGRVWSGEDIPLIGEDCPSDDCPSYGLDEEGAESEPASPRELCVEAGRDPEEVIALFLLEDLAAVLLDEGWEEIRIHIALHHARPEAYGDAICGLDWPGELIMVAERDEFGPSTEEDDDDDDEGV